MGSAHDALKRTADLVLGTAALVVLSPVMAAVAMAVKLSSPGPVFYRQARLGRGARPFRIYKFRSMVTNAPDLRNADGSAFSGDEDPRVTKVGRFIRKTSLDELPQFINVVLGDMSLVGPRPDQVDQIQYYSDEERAKLLVKPGITGLAQISGRNTISWEERKRLDVEYVHRRTLILDASIVLRTVPYVLLQRGVNAPGAGGETTGGPRT